MPAYELLLAHVVPFMQSDRERLERGKLMSWPKRVLRAQGQMVGMGVLDFLRERTGIEVLRQLMDHGYGIIGQRYYGDVTLVAKYTPKHYSYMLQNIDKKTLVWFRMQAERTTWPKIAMIQTHARVGQTLEKCLQTINQRRAQLEAQREGEVIELNTRRRHRAQLG